MGSKKRNENNFQGEKKFKKLLKSKEKRNKNSRKKLFEEVNQNK